MAGAAYNEYGRLNVHCTGAAEGAFRVLWCNVHAACVHGTRTHARGHIHIELLGSGGSWCRDVRYFTDVLLAELVEFTGSP